MTGVLESAEGDHVRLALVGDAEDRHHGRVRAAPELDQVARAQGEPKPVRLVRRGALSVAEPRRPALGGEIFEHHPGRGREEARVLGRDTRVVEHDLVVRGAPEADDFAAHLEHPSRRCPRSRFESDHEARARRRAIVVLIRECVLSAS